MKPASIRKFDILYLVSIALGAVNYALGREAVEASMRVELAAQGLEADLASTMALVVFGISMAFSLGLWALVSLLRIEFVKWIVIFLLIFSLVGLPGALATGLNLVGVVSTVAIVLQALAIYFLFRPDAKAWFKEKRRS